MYRFGNNHRFERGAYLVCYKKLSVALRLPKHGEMALILSDFVACQGSTTSNFFRVSRSDNSVGPSRKQRSGLANAKRSAMVKQRSLSP